MYTRTVGKITLAFALAMLLLVYILQPVSRLNGIPPALASALLPGIEGNIEAVSSGTWLTPAVVYVDADRHIHEIALQGTWHERDLTEAAGAPNARLESEPMAYRRSDGVSMVVYRGGDDHILALYLELVWGGSGWQEVWHWADLSAITGAPAADYDPYGYVRSDGISVVVYSGAGHIHELRLEGGWIWADLSAIAGSPTAIGRPVGFVRSDGINAVVFKGVPAQGGYLYELRLEGSWKWSNLSILYGAPAPFSDLSVYVRSDGPATINYAGADGHIYDIRYEVSWISADLTQISGAPTTLSKPSGYVRSDGMNTIVYATSSIDPGRVIELRLDNGWKYYELTSIPGAVRGFMPVGYVRTDGVSTVVYLGTDVHIHEIRLETVWHWADLSYIASAPAAAGPPCVYNRSAAGRLYLPIIVH